MKRRMFIGTMIGAWGAGALPVAGQKPGRPVGITKEQLAALLYRDILPGFTLSSEQVQLDIASPSGGTKSSIERQWTNAQQVQLQAKIQVFDNLETTSAGFAYVVFNTSGLALPRTPKGFVYGEHCASNTTGSLILFCAGRVLVNILATPYNSSDATMLAEGMAYGVDYSLHHSNLKLGVRKGEEIGLSGPGVKQQIPVGPNNVALAPLSLLKKMGVTIRPEQGGAAIITSLGKRSVKLRPFDSQVTVNAPSSPPKSLVMKAPPIFHKGQLIIPVETVAGALGIKVQRVLLGGARTIALTLPKV